MSIVNLAKKTLLNLCHLEVFSIIKINCFTSDAVWCIGIHWFINSWLDLRDYPFNISICLSNVWLVCFCIYLFIIFFSGSQAWIIRFYFSPKNRTEEWRKCFSSAQPVLFISFPNKNFSLSFKMKWSFLKLMMN